MNNTDIQIKINSIEQKIQQLEQSVDETEKVSAVELMKLKDELHEIKLACLDGSTHKDAQEQSDFSGQQQENVDSTWGSNNSNVGNIGWQPYQNQNNQGYNPNYTPNTTYEPQNYTALHNKIKENSEAISSITSKISEIGAGKVILSLVGALLIILAAGIFVGTFWESVPEIVKAMLLISAGVITGIVGLKLYEKKQLYPYIIIYAIGSAVSYIGIIAANIVYGAISIYLSIALILAWTILNLICYLRYNKNTMLVVTSIGIVASSVIISVLSGDKFDETKVFPIVYPMIGILMALLPISVDLIPRLRTKIQGLYRPLVYGTLLGSLGILLTSALSVLENCKVWHYSDYDGCQFEPWIEYLDPNGAEIAVILCVILIVLVASIIGKINQNIKNIVVNKVLTIVEIQSALGLVLAGISGLYNIEAAENFGDTLGLIIYIASICCILLGGLASGGNYKYVAYNLAVALAAFVDDIVPYDSDEKITATLYILVALAIYAAYVFLIPYLNKLIGDGECKREKVVSFIPLWITLLCCLGLDGINEINGYWVIMVLMVAAAIGVVTYDIQRELRDKSNIIYHWLYQIADTLIDIPTILLVAFFFEEYVSIFMASIVFTLLRLLKYRNKNSTLLYKVCYVAMISILAIILMIVDYDSAEGILNGVLYTISNFLTMGIFMSITFASRTHGAMRICGSLFSMLMTYLLSLKLTNSSELAMMIIIIASSVLLTMGFVKNYKSIRITSLVTLLIAVLGLVLSISDFNNSMGTVMALLGCGTIVMLISIVYSKLEKHLATRNIE